MSTFQHFSFALWDNLDLYPTSYNLRCSPGNLTCQLRGRTAISAFRLFICFIFYLFSENLRISIEGEAITLRMKMPRWAGCRLAGRIYFAGWGQNAWACGLVYRSTWISANIHSGLFCFIKIYVSNLKEWNAFINHSFPRSRNRITSIIYNNLSNFFIQFLFFPFHSLTSAFILS